MSNHSRHYSDATAEQVRLAIRNGDWKGPTSGMASGYVQVNLVILPEHAAAHFMRFCQANPRPCPVVAVSEPGERTPATLGANLDIALDVPRYRVYRQGRVVAEPERVDDLWQDDLVTFALGCSFTFDHVLQTMGVPVRHVEQNRNVPMYDTNIGLVQAGPFGGNMVVSMRPLRAADAIRSVQISSRYPQVHGAPVHLGNPSLIGIHNIARPDYGDAVDIGVDELPVFWACGVTPQQALMKADIEFAITHSPGCMLLTDIPDSQVAMF